MRLKLALLLAAALAMLAVPLTAAASALGSRSAPSHAQQSSQAEPEVDEGEEEWEGEGEEGEEEGEGESGEGAEEIEEEAKAAEEVKAASKRPISTQHKSAAKECLVPQLQHKTLAAATTELSKAHCKLGKVEKPHGGDAHQFVVIGQSDAHGRKLRAGTAVTVRLGPAKPKR